jgi:predicted transposase YbfD/YdcC
VAIDALGCQKDAAALIQEAQADYLPQVKDN